jgi:putative heme-binding domain-containing protein
MKAVRLSVRLFLLLGSACVIGSGLLLAQQPPPPIPDPFPAKNPFTGDRAGIRDGMALYRSRCADCHGMDASGYRGPDLMAVMGGGAPDERLFQTIRKGVPGTEMPSSNMRDNEIFQVLAYLHNMGAVAPSDTPAGNVAHGSELFTAQCATCHRVAGKGGRIGPDLTRVGAARSRAALVREIRAPNEVLAPNYETVTLVMKDGQRVRGTKKNEDTFSIQIMDQKERIQGYLKSDLQEVIYEKNSLMPAYGPERLIDGDLNDLVGYLSTLRGVDVKIPVQPVQ